MATSIVFISSPTFNNEQEERNKSLTSLPEHGHHPLDPWPNPATVKIHALSIF